MESSSCWICHIQQLFHERLLVFHFCELHSQVYTAKIRWSQISEAIQAFLLWPYIGTICGRRILEYTRHFAETNHLYIHLVGAIDNDMRYKKNIEPR